MEPSTTLCLQLITFTIWIGLSIALIVMGAIYKDECPIQPSIPIFLMVTGVTHLVIVSLFFLKCGIDICISILEGLIGLFSFVWFIIGSIWVFSLFHEHKAPEQCDQNLYFFAFGFLIFEYVCIGISLLIPCIRCLSKSFWYERF
ncbi:transmembrane protein 272-like [Hyla sarda]|uniref:transmembrane protein 272-like n=1 Tax=Hyla sarda TaxID=327740 RepID=UPI0024C228AD|nr:transmembrane protein 272-like [Hyla sarda]XP_056383316.1 transmembrane protein 272-like [Hyla sarda]XP_056383317.1 transmembrane protein 272-like [Hyla sarda]XP_056383318.1 transmembrane protein 272-like [Hyla sarda]XP_056383319.1 transmembrane protein 272-like [Hyla sarda]XP_056383320.1 transmembrane protein 272-like [Hyla sarda]XP_056383321.1 transmembrane protein 272-like [Hyla sarda]